MAVLGPRALEDLRIVSGIDASSILQFQMQEGMTPTEVIALAETVVGEQNQMIADQYAMVTTRTQMPSASIYRKGGAARSMTPEKTQFANTPPIRADEQGHMLPLLAYQDAIAWSEEWLQKCNREMVRNDMLEIKDRWLSRVEYGFWSRVLTNTENLIGTSGYDVGWAIGTGGNAAFIPPAWGANVFTSAHTHYVKVNAAIDATNAEAALEAAAASLAEHGHTGRKIAFVSQANIAIYAAMTASKIVRLISTGFQVQSGGNTTMITMAGTQEGVPGEPFLIFLSNYGEVELRWHARIPTGYFWMTKAYGNNDPRNAVAIRIDTGAGAGFGLRPNPQIDRSIQPRLESVRFEAKHGIGVNDRTNGVVYQITTGGATFVNPTIS